MAPTASRNCDPSEQEAVMARYSKSLPPNSEEDRQTEFVFWIVVIVIVLAAFAGLFVAAPYL
jgi:hypothetical protein